MSGSYWLATAAFWAGLGWGRLVWPRLTSLRHHIDLDHVERLQRQIRSGAIRTLDMRPPQVIVITSAVFTPNVPEQQEPTHDR